MTRKTAAAIAAYCLLFSTAACAFEMAEFRSGMTREQVKAALESWRFDKVLDGGSHTLLAFDSPNKETNRRLRFDFCNEKLAALEHSVQASARNLIVITSNFNNSFGQPMKVDAGINVLSVGEKNVLALNWRRNNEIIGVRYLLLPGAEELTVAYEAPNTCWQTPRAP